MRYERRKLTDRFIDSRKSAKEGDRDEYPDSIVTGLELRVTEKGHKSFVLLARYPKSKNPTRRSLGSYGAITLEKARDDAQAWLRLIEQGKDPEDEKAAQRAEEEQKRAEEAKRQANTWAVVVSAFLNRRASQLAKAGEARSVLEGELGQRRQWAGRAITDITPDDIGAAISAIVDRGAPYHARNCLIWIRSLFTWAAEPGRGYGLAQGYNPAKAIDADALIGKRKTRTRILTDAELRDVWQAAGDMGKPYGPLIRLLLLTGQRRDEIGEASWLEIQPADWRDNPKAAPSLVIPAERMKREAAHLVPLVPAAVEIFRGIAQGERGNFVFTTTDGELPVDGFSKAKDRIDVLMMKRHESEATARPGQTLAVSAATQREAKGKDVHLIAAGHAPFKASDVGRVIGIRHGDRSGYVRVTEFSSAKKVAVRILAAFDSTEPSDLWALGPDHWQFHDLRRSMRTHLSALPIDDIVRELIIAHAMKGVRKHYDLHAFDAEKRRGLELWAARLQSIVEPPPANVAPIDEARRKRRVRA